MNVFLFSSVLVYVHTTLTTQENSWKVSLLQVPCAPTYMCNQMKENTTWQLTAKNSVGYDREGHGEGNELKENFTLFP